MTHRQEGIVTATTRRGDLKARGLDEATTENPSFELNAALLSRTRVLTLRPLDDDEIRSLLQQALSRDPQLQGLELALDPQALPALARGAFGDARQFTGRVSAPPIAPLTFWGISPTSIFQTSSTD